MYFSLFFQIYTNTVRVIFQQYMSPFKKFGQPIRNCKITLLSKERFDKTRFFTSLSITNDTLTKCYITKNQCIPDISNGETCLRMFAAHLFDFCQIFGILWFHPFKCIKKFCPLTHTFLFTF